MRGKKFRKKDAFRDEDVCAHRLERKKPRNRRWEVDGEYDTHEKIHRRDRRRSS